MSDTAVKELAPKLEGIYKEVTGLTVLELAELVKAMESRLGISAAAPVAVARAEVPVSVSVAQEQAAAIEPVVDMPMSRQQDPAPLQVQELSAPAFQERLDSTQDLIVSTQRVVAGINAAASDQPPPIAAAFLTQTIINASQNMDAGAETASVPAVA